MVTTNLKQIENTRHKTKNKKRKIIMNLLKLSKYAAAPVALWLLLGTNAVAEDFQFFSRASDLGENHAWVVGEFSEGPYILDMHVERFANGSWTSCVPNADCQTNAGRLTFGTPLYAPADGAIKTCWRNFDDNPKPGEKLKRVTGEDGTTRRIFTAGNHVNIETADGNIILIGHMKKGSVPASLCPFNAEEADVSKNGQDYPAASIIPVGQRPQVRRGQFIGYAGNSGNSTGPHTHIHVAPKITDTTQGNTIAIPFVQAWAQSYNHNANATDAGWYKLDSEAITSASGSSLIHPSPFLRRASEGAGQVFSAEPVFLSGNRAVTAVENSLHDLMLISWDFAGPGDIIRKHEVIEGSASNVKIVAPDSSHVVVACKDASGNLKLILYHVGITGTFTRLDDVTADNIKSLDIAQTYGADKKIATLVRRDPDDRLKLLVWDVDWSTGSARLKHLSSRLEDGTVSALALTSTSNFLGVAAAVRTAEGTLKVIPYKLSANGMTITRGDDYEAGEVTSTLDITSIPKGVVAAMKDSNGVLRVISLETSTAGGIAGTKDFGVFNTGISEVKIVRTPNAGGGNVITAIRAGNGNMQLVGWSMTDRGANIRQSGSSETGSATKIGAAGHFYSVAGQPPRDVLLTALRDGDNNLKLINWEVNLKP